MDNASLDATPLSGDELRNMDRYWQACNYLSAGMIYLRSNPLLREPLNESHVKLRLLGHWGASPGLSFTYIHMNRLINKYDLDAIFLAGPGHGAPGVLGPAYLEGTYSEIYPAITQDQDGLRALFRQFSFPGGIPSHAAPETPGSIHEGGELGYSLSHAFGAVFDDPNFIVACVIGDGEAETGPLATSWHSNTFLNPITDGAVTLFQAGQPIVAAGTNSSGVYTFLVIQPGIFDLAAAAPEGTFDSATGVVANTGPM